MSLLPIAFTLSLDVAKSSLQEAYKSCSPFEWILLYGVTPEARSLESVALRLA